MICFSHVHLFLCTEPPAISSILSRTKLLYCRCGTDVVLCIPGEFSVSGSADPPVTGKRKRRDSNRVPRGCGPMSGNPAIGHYSKFECACLWSGDHLGIHQAKAGTVLNCRGSCLLLAPGVDRQMMPCAITDAIVVHDTASFGGTSKRGCSAYCGVKINQSNLLLAFAGSDSVLR